MENKKKINRSCKFSNMRTRRGAKREECQLIKEREGGKRQQRVINLVKSVHG